MDVVPLNFQTLYADLVQQVETASRDEATVVAATVKGTRYLRLQRWVGVTRTVEHLGRADDPAVQARAEGARREAARRAERRLVVSTLRRLVPSPTPKLGKVLDAAAYAGLFTGGAVLVGTGAYQCYSPVVGYRLPIGSLTTNDADLATADLALAAHDGRQTLLSVLKRADPTFAEIPSLSRHALPSRFRSADGFVVDVLTPRLRSSDPDPLPLKNLAAGATPLQHLDWLIADPIRVVALHGAGIALLAPQPARYAVHKLIVAQKRPAGQTAKRLKDLVQADALMRALQAHAPFELADALDGARARGRNGWSRPIDRSLEELAGIRPST